MAYCKNCGSKMGDDHKFCAECGTAAEIVEKKNGGWGKLILGLILGVVGLTTLFGVIGTAIGLLLSVVAVIINATKRKK